MPKYTFTQKDDLEEIFEQSEYNLSLLEDRRLICYRKKTIKSGDFLECEIYPIYNTPKAFSRVKKFRESKEAQKRLNQKNATKNLIRLINTNFTDSDIWATFTYEARKLPKTVEEAQKEFAKYLRRLKYYAARHGFPPLKYVYVTEFEDDPDKGKHRVHHHVVTNFPDRDVAEKLWRGGARKQTRRLQSDESGYEGLTRYCMKDPRGTKRYVTSKNLKKPIITVSDAYITKKKIRKLAYGEVDAQNFFERLYKERYNFTSITAKSSQYIRGVYLYVKMRRKN